MLFKDLFAFFQVMLCKDSGSLSILWLAKVLFHPKIAAHAKKWDFKHIIG
jgi:hypothetical protein